jgi:hypothetical protein
MAQNLCDLLAPQGQRGYSCGVTLTPSNHGPSSRFQSLFMGPDGGPGADSQPSRSLPTSSVPGVCAWTCQPRRLLCLRRDSGEPRRRQEGLSASRTPWAYPRRRGHCSCPLLASGTPSRPAPPPGFLPARQLDTCSSTCDLPAPLFMLTPMALPLRPVAQPLKLNPRGFFPSEHVDAEHDVYAQRRKPIDQLRFEAIAA